MTAAPARAAADPSADSLLARLAVGREERLLHVEERPPRAAQHAQWPSWLPADVVATYRSVGIAQPWSHQLAAAQLAHDGQHVALATGTASGKSVAFGMTALARIRAGLDAPNGRGATVLYLAPTKALANDQLRALRQLDLPWLRATTYDGDSPEDERAWARQHANYLLSNPDMLHRSMLPGHERWASFLRRLEVVVVDEAHTYRGVLGAHVSAVLRRLRRLCAHYGASPVVVCASATVANPEEAAARLVGAPAVPVVDDGSPRPAVTIAFWEPGLRRGTGDGPPERRGVVTETADLVADTVVEGHQVLAFIRSRRGAESAAVVVRALLAEVDPALAAGVAAYRGGYLPEERRELEVRLRDGSIRAMAATSALEMGIDVSGLDVVITAGWPGTRASLWQQFGRAGRADAPALGIFVARDDPLDAYVVHHPEAVLGRGVEASVFDPDNPYVLAPHLCAAAAESPLKPDDVDAWFGPAALPVLDRLVADGLLRRRSGGWFWTLRERACDLTDLRGSGGPVVRVVEDGTGRLLGTVDSAAAPGVVHEGAVYLHQGVSHVVKALDLDAAVASVVVEEVDYSTVARSVSDIRIVHVEREQEHGPLLLSFGSVDVSSQVVSFQRRRPDGQLLGEQALDLPVRELRTRAVWWTVPEQTLTGAGIAPADLPGALHAAEHAAIGILPLFATCDRWDLGGVSTAGHLDTGLPTVFVYDGYPGGAGFAEHGFGRFRVWTAATRTAIADCGCETGCPACVQSPKCGNGNNPLDKAGAVRLLDLVLAALDHS